MYCEPYQCRDSWAVGEQSFRQSVARIEQIKFCLSENLRPFGSVLVGPFSLIQPKILSVCLRARLAGAKVDEVVLLALRASQLQLRREITREVDRLCQKYTNSRHALIAIDQGVAIELLGAVIKHVAGVRPTRPQLVRALLAIKTAKRGTVFQLGGGIVLDFTTRNYTVSVV